ncbi:universal stress protein [Gillisia sp. M10.2A]|uniref:Universal stress protein n=1 Tax=Gillisia lutea TaxID=2909668 RepID=A0ABS9EH13_9FLAO|nr:universal stress protein [Gillisia lutea]MCF4101114.1 universal stress protein [Gillisia lutea]
MKKKILLPTDFSDNAWNAIKYATALYKNVECQFYVLNAFTTTYFTTDSMLIPEPGEKFYDIAQEKSERFLKIMVDKLNEENKDYKHIFTAVSQYNSPVEAIKEVVDEKDIELVVMGTKGETDSKNTIYGSITVSVMEKVRNSPVLMIPGDVTYKKLNEVVFPTSYKTPFKKRELNFLVEIVKITKAPIRIFHINKENALSERQINNKYLLEECLEDVIFTFHWMDHEDVIEGLHEFVQKRESDMIVFINKKHAFFGSIFTRPMVKVLGYNSHIPVLVLHDLKN